MRAGIAAALALVLSGCATLPLPPGMPREAHHHSPHIYYGLPAYLGYVPSPVPGAYPRYAVPYAPPPASQAAPPPPGGPAPVPGIPPPQPYTQEQMATGIAEAVGLAALITSGAANTAPSQGGTRRFGDDDLGNAGPDFHLDGESPTYSSSPEPYSCSWGYASMGTCVGPR